MGLSSSHRLMSSSLVDKVQIKVLFLLFIINLILILHLPDITRIPAVYVCQIRILINFWILI